MAVATADHVMLAHGGGGELTRRLIAERILPRLANPLLAPLDDSAVLPIAGGRVCLTTDAYVVQPLEFAGGDIGRLAVCGTVNDLVVAGARPTALSLALVIEEGLPLETLDRILESIAAAAQEAGVVIATGDTKVVERRGGDGLTITTAGVGELRPEARLDARRIEAGDVLIVTGSLAEHGLAVMAAREGLGIQTDLRSDVAPLSGLIDAAWQSGADIRFMRDPTRGGLAGVLADLAEDTGLGIDVEEPALPLTRGAQHLAELLGLDPLMIANEGKCVIVAPSADAECVLAACHGHQYGREARVIGRFAERSRATAELCTVAGGRRVIARPYGEDLPRIC